MFFFLILFTKSRLHCTFNQLWCVGKYKAIIVKSRESKNKEIPWFGHEDLHPPTKALNGYIFII